MPLIPNKFSISLGHSAAPRPDGMWLTGFSEWVFQFSSRINTLQVVHHHGTKCIILFETTEYVKNETKHAMTWCGCLCFIKYVHLEACAHSQAATLAYLSGGCRAASSTHIFLRKHVLHEKAALYPQTPHLKGCFKRALLFFLLIQLLRWNSIFFIRIINWIEIKRNLEYLYFVFPAI